MKVLVLDEQNNDVQVKKYDLLDIDLCVDFSYSINKRINIDEVIENKGLLRRIKYYSNRLKRIFNIFLKKNQPKQFTLKELSELAENRPLFENKTFKDIENEMMSLVEVYGQSDGEYKIFYFDKKHIHKSVNKKTFVTTEYDILGIWLDEENRYITFYGLTGNEEGAFFFLGDFDDTFIEEIYKEEIQNYEADIIK